MALNTQVSSSFSDHVLAFIEKMFLDRLMSELHLAKLGKQKTLGANQGETVKWNRLSNLAANVTALTEGTTPNGQNISSAAVTATLYQYGGYVTIADWFKMTEVNDTMRETTDILAYQAALSIDSLVRNECDANGTQVYAAGAASKALVESGTEEMSSSDLKKITKAMRVADVPGPLKGVIHPLMEFSLMNESGATDYITLASHNTTASAVIDNATIGRAFDLELSRSSNIRADATEVNTYGNIFVGRDAFGVVDLASAGVKMIKKDFGAAGTEDPLNQRATIAYKFVFGVKMLEAVRCQVLWAYGA